MATPTAAADTAAAPLTPVAPEPAAKFSLASSDMAAPTAAADTSAPPPPAPVPPTAAADTSAPPPPAPSPPTAGADTAAPPPPPPPTTTEPAAKVSHSPYHMAAPTATAETVGRPIPPPPAPEIAAKVSHFPPPFPPQPDAPAPKRRKLEEAGFHTSAYYKIRATVADLRLRFVQVHEATDFRKSDAAREILREIKTVMELSKKMRLDLGVSSEPMKPSEKPLAGAVKDEPAEPIPSGERNQVPPTGQPAVPPNIANDGAPATQA
ncbi:vegetative cell wall protein gp1-like [Triticum urartu]|nr:vegetative cell wall protein gp1-like [Triticum urartu]